MKSAAVKWAAGIFMESTAKSSPLSGGAGVAQLKREERSRADAAPLTLERVAQISQTFKGRRDPFEHVLRNFGSGEYQERLEAFRLYIAMKRATRTPVR